MQCACVVYTNCTGNRDLSVYACGSGVRLVGVKFPGSNCERGRGRYICTHPSVNFKCITFLSVFECLVVYTIGAFSWGTHTHSVVRAVFRYITAPGFQPGTVGTFTLAENDTRCRVIVPC